MTKYRYLLGAAIFVLGLTGRRYRAALVAGIAARPGRHEEIIGEFLKIDPAGESGKEFIESYAVKKYERSK